MKSFSSLLSQPQSILERTDQLRQQIPSLLQSLHIQSIVDCGCGDWSWFQTIPLQSIHYTGLDIVPELIQRNQTLFKGPTVRFRQMDCVAQEGPHADLWLARDFCNGLDKPSILRFLKEFCKSNSKYLALTTVSNHKNDGEWMTGIVHPIDLTHESFGLPEPIAKLADGEQWFRKKWLFVYTHSQIQTWITLNSSNFVKKESYKPYDTLDRNAHLVSNVPLRLATQHVHKG